MNTFMDWLPLPPTDWLEKLKAIDAEPGTAAVAERLWELSRFRLDILQVNSLHKRLRSYPARQGSSVETFSTLRVALLASSTMEQVVPALEVAAFRRHMLLQLYLCPYGQYRQDILDPQSGLHAFKPDVVVLALDAAAAPPPPDLLASADEVEGRIRAQVDEWRTLWRLLTQKGWAVIQQTIVVPPRSILGHLDAATPGTPHYWYAALNRELLAEAKDGGILVFDVDSLAGQVGKDQWLNDPLWHHAKQSFSPQWALLYADHVARLLAAIRGLSKKCLILDLDNTLWGGILGDDGLDQIEIGPGTAVGEAYLAFQRYVQQLKTRGVVLGICSKNNEALARQAFENHPEMILRLEDFASFAVNWQDKATNLNDMAARLHLGLDSCVFFDDNPVERHFIRQALPMVEVPEVPEDPADYIACLSNAGYFEAISLTRDDAERSAQYAANQKRVAPPAFAQDLDSFLKSLQMKMAVAPFDDVARPRIAQLINKSNQFNLTTRRYTEHQVEQMQHNSRMLTFQVRLEDLYGDNGLISVVILEPLPGIETSGESWLINTWLMSCRVLGRRVEQEVLNVVVQQLTRRGARFLWGDYIPTAKNALVRDHYAKLGFAAQPSDSTSAETSTRWRLSLTSFVPVSTWIESHYAGEALQNV